ARRAARAADCRARRPHARPLERRAADGPDAGQCRRHGPHRGRVPRLVTHVQALIDAVGLGAVFALIAVGIGLVFGVLRLVNFPYGQLIMIAAFMLVFTDSWPDGATVLVAVATAVLASFVMERVAFRPLRTASPATMLVATFAISFLLQNVA